MSIQSSTHSTIHSRSIKWTHIGRRSLNGGMFKWARKELKNKTNHYTRKTCNELIEWEQEKKHHAYYQTSNVWLFLSFSTLAIIYSYRTR